ncbi:MAG: hypothetical protein LPJ89_02415 [Hymenobacteraceae bacterium]|nr:hypothetical protein [Hymenobacteraceae bacterium]MDX5442619.1 hypothetical protein [Hymenobacteraceae bacterium]MDX5511151.1 hypothetical protein [Hymenobacteraceae bacterium]
MAEKENKETFELRDSHGTVYLTFTADKENDLYVAKWHNHITAKEVYTAGEKYLELMAKQPYSSLVNDKSEVSGDWQEANDWLEYEWFPKAKKAGLKHFAYIFSTEMYSYMSGQDLYKRLKEKVDFDICTSLEKAMDWLKEIALKAKNKTTS